jgi:hypothetical protein
VDYGERWPDDFSAVRARVEPTVSALVSLGAADRSVSPGRQSPTGLASL